MSDQASKSNSSVQTFVVVALLWAAIFVAGAVVL
jgi:hypothetical protein